MRVLFALTALSVTLMGCNGGEDFSDATVAGCPAGAGCTPSSRGEVFVELVGPRVENLGYRCGGTEVVFFTDSEETTSVRTNGESITVPPFNALCPSTSQDIEFFIGNGLFEGNFISLGKIVFPRQEALERYTVTAADLVNSPWRVSSGEPQVRNIAALIQGLDSDPLTPDIVEIPDEAHDIADNQPELISSLTTADYLVFVDDWSEGDAGTDTYFEAVNDALAMPVPGPDDMNPDVHLDKVKAANRYTSAGNYSFRSCLFITCRDARDDNPDAELADQDIVGLTLPGLSTNNTSLGEPPLILPSGKVMGLGFVERGSGVGDFRREMVAFSATSRINELLQFETADLVSIEPGSADTDMEVQGRFLNKLMYSNFLPEQGVSDTDIEINYPSLSDSLAEADEGNINGELLGDGADLPFTAEVEAEPQAEPDQATIDMLASNGPYILRLMRACLGPDDEPEQADCTAIPDEEQEAAEDGSGNYPPVIITDVEEEQPRSDYFSNSTDVCLEVISNPGQPDNGIVVAGFSDGSCPTPTDQWQVGFVSRTFLDGSNSPESANLSLLFAPDAQAPGDTSHFGVTVQGRIDLVDADGCMPMYRTGDTNFGAKLRAAWVDGKVQDGLLSEFGYYPYLQEKDWVDALPPKPEGENTIADLEEWQQGFLVAITYGAVQFFAGLPGDGTCDPLVP